MQGKLKVTQSKGKTKQEYIEELENEGYSTFEWSDPPDAYYPPHTHNHDECICIVTGKTTW